MELVIDANILFAAVISPGISRKLVYNESFRLFSPVFLLKEVEKYKLEIFQKSGLSKEDFDGAFSLLLGRVMLVGFSEFEPWIKKAKAIAPDDNDVEYFALALAKRCPLWSNDKRLKEQKEVKIFSTSELLPFLS